MKNNKKTYIKIYLILLCFILALGVTGCANSTGNKPSDIEENVEEELITVGFSQLGAESDWRSANTESIRQAFSEENGYRLIFEDAQQKQTNQITAIRSFIQQEVDFIILAPVTEDGWDTVLTEAKEANIPVIIIDRMVDVSNEDLYVGWIGSDFKLEGDKVCQWINMYTKAIGMSPWEVNIADIQGTLGSSAQLGRSKSIKEAAAAYGWNLLAIRMGEFTQTKGREAMRSILQSYPEVNVVYCENDNEALGAIQAIEEAGRTVGSDIKSGDIMIVSFDGVNKEALANLENGGISCIGECNPLIGPRAKAMIEDLIEGKTVGKREYIEESLYSSLDIVKSISVDDVIYDVTIVTN